MGNERLSSYVNAVHKAIADGTQFQFTQRCMDCDQNLTGTLGLGDDDHVTGMIESADQKIPFVIVGCGGYWHVNPRVLGIDAGNWMSIEDVNDDM